MAKFLHIADVHLGISRYRRFGTADRTRDFFDAWNDCIERYALGEQVDFVLIAGDFFDTRRVEPQAMNHAMFGLMKLKNAGIPVIVVEGNHDQREASQQFSWLRSLSRWGFIKLLEPFEDDDGTVRFDPWNEATGKGSYFDLDTPDGRFRIFGTTWYGTTVARQLPALVDELSKHRCADRFHVMLLHTDVEGQLNRPIPALPIAKINELKSVVDYLALGHTHKNFEIDGWVYNPGSLEACNIDEYANVRGAYLVEVKHGRHEARLMRDYHQRPFVRVRFEVGGYATPEELREALLAQLHNEVAPHDPDEETTLAPVLEVTLAGQLGFKSSLLELNRLREEIKDEFRPFLCIARDVTIPVEYAVATGSSEHHSHAERERRVIESLIARDARFQEHAGAMTELMLEAKRLALAEEQPEKIVALIEQRLSLLPSKAIESSA
ncbi:MAG TPA: DNA repair exonuclease [Blastocatellia bacterium]|nr:DNA repair exonuclease [Blastocatellia bacterium]